MIKEAKKFVIEMIISEHIENENMDSIYLKKTLEICTGTTDTLETLKRHYEDLKLFIETKLGDGDKIG